MIALANIDIDLFSFTVDNVSVAAGADYDLELDLEKDGYTVAEITLWIKGTVTTSAARRKSAFIIATRTLNECFGQTNHKYWVGFSSGVTHYSNFNWRYEGFSYATDSRLSEADFDKLGSSVQIIHAWIDGKTLKIRFHNTSTSAKYLELNGRVRAERTKVV